MNGVEVTFGVMYGKIQLNLKYCMREEAQKCVRKISDDGKNKRGGILFLKIEVNLWSLTANKGNICVEKEVAYYKGRRNPLWVAENDVVGARKQLTGVLRIDPRQVIIVNGE